MPLVAGVDAAALLLLLPLQWSCLPSLYAPRWQEDGIACQLQLLQV